MWIVNLARRRLYTVIVLAVFILVMDLPRLGYSAGTNVRDLVAKGYRWVTVNGPYACATQKEVRQITSHYTDLTELQMLEDGDGYYLIPGTLVRVIRDDPGNGMSQILLGGITKPVWTYTRFLTARPIHDMYGIVETPDTAFLVDPSAREAQIEVQPILQTTQILGWQKLSRLSNWTAPVDSAPDQDSAECCFALA